MDAQTRAQPVLQTMSVEEAAKALGVGRSAAYEAVKAGQIPSIRIGRKLRVPLAAFNRLLESAGQGSVAA